MNKQESLAILNKCFTELDNMNQEEFDIRIKEAIGNNSTYTIDPNTVNSFSVILDPSTIDSFEMKTMNLKDANMLQSLVKENQK